MVGTTREAEASRAHSWWQCLHHNAWVQEGISEFDRAGRRYREVVFSTPEERTEVIFFDVTSTPASPGSQ